MVAPPEDLRYLRQHFAVNQFKRRLLGAGHEPGKPQTREVLAALERAGQEADVIDPRTWESWFSGSPRVAHPRTVRRLDRVASEMGIAEGAERSRPTEKSDYFRRLIEGGLASDLRAPTRSKRPQHVLVERATDYEPASAWHLHLDAIECCTLVNDIVGVPWDIVRAIASERVLQILHARWSPRRGTVYGVLPSDFKLKWDAADDAQRAEMRKVSDQWVPSPLQKYLEEPPSPRWAEVPVEADVAPVHAHRLLFALAYNNFLVADRFEAWALDMATSALAHFGLVWTDRYASMGMKGTGEIVYLKALAYLFFEDVSEDERSDALLHVMASLADEWPTRSLEVLNAAGSWYRRELRLRGLAEGRVWSIAQDCVKTHALCYSGGHAIDKTTRRDGSVALDALLGSLVDGTARVPSPRR